MTGAGRLLAYNAFRRRHSLALLAIATSLVASSWRGRNPVNSHACSVLAVPEHPFGMSCLTEGEKGLILDRVHRLLAAEH